jgi:hypothetical protein
MRKVALLAAVALLTALTAAAASKSPLFAALATATPEPVTISIQELHRQVDAASLPVIDTKDFY